MNAEFVPILITLTLISALCLELKHYLRKHTIVIFYLAGLLTCVPIILIGLKSPLSLTLSVSFLNISLGSVLAGLLLKKTGSPALKNGLLIGISATIGLLCGLHQSILASCLTIALIVLAFGIQHLLHFPRSRHYTIFITPHSDAPPKKLIDIFNLFDIAPTIHPPDQATSLQISYTCSPATHYLVTRHISKNQMSTAYNAL